MQLEVLEERQLLATITVNTTGDDSTPDSTLSLRQAIEVSDGTLAVSALTTQEQAQISGAVGTSNTIEFNIPKSDSGYDSATGMWTIKLSSGLPAISTNAAIINGYTQTGASQNTLTEGDNAKVAIAINGGNVTSVGLEIDQPGSEVTGLDIGNFSAEGVLVAAPGNVTVAGNFIGTDPTGKTAVPNGEGVVIENSSNLIGGANVGDRNVISGNVTYGIFVPDQAADPLNVQPMSNSIENNFIGTDATGSKALANGTSGVYDSGTDDLYGGGANPAERNVISGNKYGGLICAGSILIEGNYIGTDATGSIALGNGAGYDGISDIPGAGAPETTTISYNVVSGNTGGNISLSPPPDSRSSSKFTITNNYIGTNAEGTAGLASASVGLQLISVENATVTDNLISANQLGIELTGFGSDLANNIFQGNLIGTDKTGQVALGNLYYGISLSNSATGNLIGGTGPGQGNVIAYNGSAGAYAGIYISGQQNQVTENSIFGNAGAGIQLDFGANKSASPPVLTFTPGGGGSGTLSGILTSAPNTNYTIEIFSNLLVPTVGLEQGRTFIQDVKVTTDNTGKASFSVKEPTGIYTATATDSEGNTSAFSATAGSQSSLAASTTTVASIPNPSTFGQVVTFTATVTAPTYQGTPTGTVTFFIDGKAQTPAPLSAAGGADQAFFTTSTLSVGLHTVSASYSGDSNVSGSSGSLPTETVIALGLHKTTTTLTSSLNPSTVGEPVTFTAIVSPDGTAGNPSGSVTFTIDGVSRAPEQLHMVGGTDEAILTVTSLAKGTHTIKASYSGDSSFAASAVANPLIETVNAVALPGGDGPTIDSVQRFGIHMQPTVVVVTFNDPLDPTSAVNRSNYRITDPSGHRVGIESAVFDAATNSVTLRTANRINLHHTYDFTVIGTGQNGVRNTHGVLLDGADTGSPGNNYTGTLTWRNVVLTPAEIARYVRLRRRLRA
jgi:hypothetical protein